MCKEMGVFTRGEDLPPFSYFYFFFFVCVGVFTFFLFMIDAEIISVINLQFDRKRSITLYPSNIINDVVLVKRYSISSSHLLPAVLK